MQSFIPKFWENTNNNNNNNNDIINKEINVDNRNSNSNNNNENLQNNLNVNVLTILRKYQKIFNEIETLISSWEYSENNLFIVFKNILSFLERYNILINTSTISTINSNEIDLNNDSNGIRIDYFRLFKDSDNNNNNYNSIEFELKLKLIDKLEESMISLDEYQREMKKVIEKFDSFKIEIDQYWETNIFSLKSLSTTTTTTIDKNIYIKINELNQGSFSNSPITQIDQWFHFIVNQFKLEFQRRDSLLKNLEYNKPIEQLNSIFANYEKNTTFSLNNIREIIPKVNGVIKEIPEKSNVASSDCTLNTHCILLEQLIPM
ncbi:hypothetical protein ACTFIW_000665 [Dictyostelium discoideum]